MAAAWRIELIEPIGAELISEAEARCEHRAEVDQDVKAKLGKVDAHIAPQQLHPLETLRQAEEEWSGRRSAAHPAVGLDGPAFDWDEILRHDAAFKNWLDAFTREGSPVATWLCTPGNLERPPSRC